MYRIGDYLVYKKDVCKVREILEKETGNYYLLVPVNDPSLKIQASVDSDGIRELITRKELDKLLNNISNIEIIDCDEKMIEYEYKQLLCSGTKEDLIKLIKTTYLRNKYRLENKKRKNLKDSEYMEKAEKLLYTEISVVLNLSIEETQAFIINKVEGMVM